MTVCLSTHRKYLPKGHSVDAVRDVEGAHGKGYEVVHVLVRVLHAVACHGVVGRERAYSTGTQREMREAVEGGNT